MATKQQEREALDKIAEIIKGLGQDSYIAAAFDGCLDMAEDNIGNDFMCSMKARAEEAQKEVANLLVENRKQADGLGKPRAIGRNEVDMDTLGARQKGYRDGLKFDPNSRLEGEPERVQLASCR